MKARPQAIGEASAICRNVRIILLLEACMLVEIRQLN